MCHTLNWNLPKAIEAKSLISMAAINYSQFLCAGNVAKYRMSTIWALLLHTDKTHKYSLRFFSSCFTFVYWISKYHYNYTKRARFLNGRATDLLNVNVFLSLFNVPFDDNTETMHKRLFSLLKFLIASSMHLSIWSFELILLWNIIIR